MDFASIIAIAAGSSVLGGTAVAIVNGIFGRAKARADVARTYNQMAADTAVRNRELVGAIEKLTDAVDRVIPVLDRLAGRENLTSAEVISLRAVTPHLRQANSAARRAI